MECIILAGGLGTRLRGVIGEQPKCMAPVNGKPFLQYLFAYLEVQNCTRVILSLGYKYEVVLQWLSADAPSFPVDYVLEHEPLGTGGGIALAMQKVKVNDAVVLNGDTMMQVHLQNLLSFHQQQKSEVTVTLKEMKQFDRYGVVKIDDNDNIIAFEEKSYLEEGLINAGVYVINKEALSAKNLPAKFSFEKDYLEKQIVEKKVKGFISDGYFIDIGVPADYQKAQTDFSHLF